MLRIAAAVRLAPDWLYAHETLVKHFIDRDDAGRRLAVALHQQLPGHQAGDGAVVLALPRGGVPVAAPVAAALGAPLGLLIVRKIGAPSQPELAMGAVASGGVVIRNEPIIRAIGLTEAEFGRATALAEAELGVPLDRAFSFVDPEPLAAASLGQAHRATLSDDDADI